MLHFKIKSKIQNYLQKKNQFYKGKKKRNPTSLEAENQYNFFVQLWEFLDAASCHYGWVALRSPYIYTAESH